jgi:hypothetical protein
VSVISKNPLVPISALQWRTLRLLYSDGYLREVQKAMMLATDLEACKALLRGESVPPSRIDWEQAKRFGSRL